MSSAAGFRLVVDDDLELRLFAETDSRPLFELVDGNREYLRRWLNWVDSIATVDDQRTFVRESRAGFEMRDPAPFSLGIWEHGALVGVIGFVYFDRKNRKTEIGYWLAAEVQGRGVMTRACRALVSFAFHDLMFNRVEIQCATGNARSASIPGRLGFRLEGTSRDAE